MKSPAIPIPDAKAVLNGRIGERVCRHCGTPFTSRDGDSLYCCTGCEYVSKLIHNENLDRFYELKNEPIPPVQSRAFEVRDYSWMTSCIQKAKPDSHGIVGMDFSVQGLSCFGCVWLIENLFEREKGAGSISINPSTATLHLKIHQKDFDAESFARTIQRFGYPIAPLNEVGAGETSRLKGRLGLCAAFAMNNMLFSLPFYLGMSHDSEFAGLFYLMIALLATLSMAVGGSYFIQKAVYGLRHGILHMDLPISIGICAAYIGSLFGLFYAHSSLMYFDFISTFIFLMLVGKWIQESNVEKNRARLLKLNMCPQQTTLFENEKSTVGTTLTIRDVAPAQILGIKPGEMIPVSGTLLSTSASLSMSWINGESEIRILEKGQTVPSGAIHVGQHSLRYRTSESWEQSLLSRLLQRNAPEKNVNPLMEKTLKVYIATVIVIAIGAGLFWAFALNHPMQAVQVFISLLIVSCPCALGLSYPLMNEIAVLYLQNLGVFIRSQSVWPRLRKVRKIIFDKTGTLTLETPVLRNKEILSRMTVEERKILYRMVLSSLHPVSRSLKEELVKTNPEFTSLDKDPSIDEVPGMGLLWKESSSLWSLGRIHWRGQGSNPSGQNPSSSATCEFCRDAEPVASFEFEDTLKANAENEITHLVNRGYEVHILSGDSQRKVAAVLSQLGLHSSHVLDSMTPDEKAEWIRTNAPQSALMIGDGANDSLAFDASICRGTPVVDRNFLEQKSEFYFVGNSLHGIRELFQVADSRRWALFGVFIFAIFYNIVAGILCIMGRMNPFAAALLMPLSSVMSLALGTFIMARGLRDKLKLS